MKDSTVVKDKTEHCGALRTRRAVGDGPISGMRQKLACKIAFNSQHCHQLAMIYFRGIDLVDLVVKS